MNVTPTDMSAPANGKGIESLKRQARLEKEIRKKLTVSLMVISRKKMRKKRPEKELQQLIFDSSSSRKKKMTLNISATHDFFSFHSFHKKSTEWIQQKQNNKTKTSLQKKVIKKIFS